MKMSLKKFKLLQVLVNPSYENLRYSEQFVHLVEQNDIFVIFGVFIAQPSKTDPKFLNHTGQSTLNLPRVVLEDLGIVVRSFLLLL